MTANGSRRTLDLARTLFPGLTILSVTARPETLASRLDARGREEAATIAARLALTPAQPVGANVIEIDNHGPLDAAVATMLAAVQPVSA